MFCVFFFQSFQSFRFNNSAVRFSVEHSTTPKGSQTLTQDGSSFESASSIYSLARVDPISDEASIPAPIVAAVASTTVGGEDKLSLPPSQSTKPSPSHSISSSSSGSYRCLVGAAKKVPKPASTSPRPSIVKAIPPSVQVKTESISDDEKSEKRYSSSGYYESPQDDGKCGKEANFLLSGRQHYYYLCSFSRAKSTKTITRMERRRTTPKKGKNAFGH